MCLHMHGGRAGTAAKLQEMAPASMFAAAALKLRDPSLTTSGGIAREPRICKCKHGNTVQESEST